MKHVLSFSSPHLISPSYYLGVNWMISHQSKRKRLTNELTVYLFLCIIITYVKVTGQNNNTFCVSKLCVVMTKVRCGCNIGLISRVVLKN